MPRISPTRSLTSTDQFSWEESGGTVTSTANLTRVFSSVETLNLRSDGPGALTMAAMLPSASGSAPSAADAQKMAMAMMSAMEHTANWIVVGDALDDDAADPSVGIAGKAATARVDYTRVEAFDRTTTTFKGARAVMAGGTGVVKYTATMTPPKK